MKVTAISNAYGRKMELTVCRYEGEIMLVTGGCAGYEIVDLERGLIRSQQNAEATLVPNARRRLLACRAAKTFPFVDRPE